MDSVRERYDAVPETVAEKVLYYAGITGVTVVMFILLVIASGIF